MRVSVPESELAQSKTRLGALENELQKKERTIRELRQKITETNPDTMSGTEPKE